MNKLLQFNAYMIMLILVIINGLNSGSIVFFNQNIVKTVLGQQYARYFYMVVGVAALILAYRLVMKIANAKLKQKEMMKQV